VTSPIGHANDGLRFVLELSGLAALAYWGFGAAEGALRAVLGIGAPLAMAATWGVFMSPRAPMRLKDPLRLLAELAIFGAACAALSAAEQHPLAILLAVVVAVHLTLTFPLRQR
jgi:hypothetical protein